MRIARARAGPRARPASSSTRATCSTPRQPARRRRGRGRGLLPRALDGPRRRRGDFAERERAAATALRAHGARRGRRARRVPRRAGDARSEHLRSRAETARCSPRRAAAHLLPRGHGDRRARASPTTLRYLVERLPAMIAPSWLRNRTQPIADRRRARVPGAGGRAAGARPARGPDRRPRRADLRRAARPDGRRARHAPPAAAARAAAHAAAVLALDRPRDAGRRGRGAAADRGPRRGHGRDRPGAGALFDVAADGRPRRCDGPARRRPPGAPGADAVILPPWRCAQARAASRWPRTSRSRAASRTPRRSCAWRWSTTAWLAAARPLRSTTAARPRRPRWRSCATRRRPVGGGRRPFDLEAIGTPCGAAAAEAGAARPSTRPCTTGSAGGWGCPCGGCSG